VGGEKTKADESLYLTTEQKVTGQAEFEAQTGDASRGSPPRRRRRRGNRTDEGKTKLMDLEKGKTPSD
jgi:hypothetical protein